MKNSAIEWTDHTFNPWEGCTKVSPGCAHCYAETRNARFGGGTAPNWGVGAPRRRHSVHNWNEPRRWDAVAQLAGEFWKAVQDPSCPADIRAGCTYSGRPRVFCASLADVFDEEVDHKWREDLWMLIKACPNLDWLLLTKRPQNVLNMVPLAWRDGGWPANVWMGTTVEDQKRADERIPILLSIPAKVRFLSCEPLLGPVDLKKGLWQTIPLNEVHGSVLDDGGYACREFLKPRAGINWVICGGESGPGARPMHPDWARSLRDQCASANVPFFFKQWGEWVQYIDCDNEDPDWQQDYSRIKGSDSFCYLNLAGGCGFHGERLHVMQRVGKKIAGRALDAAEHNEFPNAQ